MQLTDLSLFMNNAVAEVLETMCFIASEGEAADDGEQLSADWISGELDFCGDASGRFGIAVPPATAATIAANFLGEEELDLTDLEIREVICELTNMTCGTLLAQVNSKNVFTLSPPRSDTKAVSLVQPDGLHRLYMLDEGCIHAWVEMRASA